MAVHRAFTCYALALTVLIGPTVAEAQQQKQKSCNDLASEEVLEARRACFEEAKIRASGPAEAGAFPVGFTKEATAQSTTIIAQCLLSLRTTVRADPSRV